MVQPTTAFGGRVTMVHRPGIAAMSVGRFFFLLLSIVLCAAEVSADPGKTIGSVKIVAGEVRVTRSGVALTVRSGFLLQAGDTLETGPDGRLGVILRDDSLLSLGPSSRVTIEKFLFAPGEGHLGLTARILRGTMAYLSGLIGRLAPESAIFVTPVATVGVRGTHFAVQVGG